MDNMDDYEIEAVARIVTLAIYHRPEISVAIERSGGNHLGWTETPKTQVVNALAERLWEEVEAGAEKGSLAAEVLGALLTERVCRVVAAKLLDE